MGRGRHHVGRVGPTLRQHRGWFGGDRLQHRTGLTDARGAGGASANAEYHHLFEALLRRLEHPYLLEVGGDPSRQFPVQAVAGDDQHQYAAEGEPGIGQAVEQLLQPGTALARVAGQRRLVCNQVAIGRVEPQQAELASADDAVLHVAVDAAVQDALGVPGPLLVVLHAEGLGPVGTQVVFALGQGHALAAAGIEDAKLPRIPRL